MKGGFFVGVFVGGVDGVGVGGVREVVKTCSSRLVFMSQLVVLASI